MKAVLIRGAGDLASGVAFRLHRAGFPVIMTEVEHPSAVRRTVCFSEAVYRGRTTVEDVEAVRAENFRAAEKLSAGNIIPVLIDPGCTIKTELRPDILIDAVMAKRNTGTAISDAPLVIALGPGFTAGVDCHVVIETMRGHTLGRVLRDGAALPNTGVPGDIGGHTTDRLLRAPADGVFFPRADIGDTIAAGQTAAEVRGDDGAVTEVRAQISGVLRGILPEEFRVRAGMKAGDIDPRCERGHCFTISDKAFAVSGGVLEAVCSFYAETYADTLFR